MRFNSGSKCDVSAIAWFDKVHPRHDSVRGVTGDGSWRLAGRAGPGGFHERTEGKERENSEDDLAASSTGKWGSFGSQEHPLF